MVYKACRLSLPIGEGRENFFMAFPIGRGLNQWAYRSVQGAWSLRSVMGLRPLPIGKPIKLVPYRSVGS